MPRIKLSGFTLIELMITVAVIAIVAALALPSFKDTIENRKLIAAANTLQSDLMFAKSAAIKQNRLIFVSFANEGNAAWCYGFNESAACDCTVANDCTLESQEMVKDMVSLPSVIPDGSTVNDISFNPSRGFANSGATITFSISNKTTGVDLNLSGHARACSDSALGGMSGC